LFEPQERSAKETNVERFIVKVAAAQIACTLGDLAANTRKLREFADLMETYELRRGAEELSAHLNSVYEALIDVIHRFDGSVIAFAGDAITCWFADDRGLRAAAAALELQTAMDQFAEIRLADGQIRSLAVKTGVACGPVCRFLVGNPEIHLLDVIAGNTGAATKLYRSQGLREVEVPFPVWRPLTDNYPSLSVGTLAFDRDNPNILYGGTGGNSSSAKGGPSIGLYKTEDGGNTFRLLGVDEFTDLRIRDITTQNYTATGLSVQYDAVHKRLTVFFKPGDDAGGRANQLITAINTIAHLPLTAARYLPLTNDGTGTLPAAAR
jgi:hypothetical protein